MRVLAVDLGGSHVTCGAVDDTLLLNSIEIPSDSSGRLSHLLPALAESLRHLSAATGGQFSGIGFGFCGLVDSAAGRVLSTNQKYADATTLDFAEWARQEFDLPLALENDARMALLGEQRAGAARGAKNIVMMTLGTGIGTAVMMEGRLMRGAHSQAGCLGGHFTVRPDGNLCSCGALGCFEAEASSYALPVVCSNWPGFTSSMLVDEETLNFRVLFRCANAGDRVACEIREHCSQIWNACGLSLVHAYDPEILIVGGGVLNGDYPVIDSMRRHIHQFSWTPWGKVDVVPAKLGSQAALFGAVGLFEARA